MNFGRRAQICRVLLLALCSSCGNAEDLSDLAISEGCPDNSSMKKSVDGACVCKDPAYVLSTDGMSCAYGDAADIYAGWHHSCARMSSGRLLCWGSNGSGQVGAFDENDVDRKIVRPLAVGVEEPIRAVGLGARHSCIVFETGGVACWGSDSHGQLGNGEERIDQVTPGELIRDLEASTSICAGRHHTCALSMSGKVSCWGENSWLQLGVDREHSGTPVMTTLGSVTSLACGFDHACAISVDGNVSCWGRNDERQLGTGEIDVAALPRTLTNLPGMVRQVAIGQSHTCGLVNDGAVFCWGNNEFGQLGEFAADARQGVPVEVKSLGAPAEQLSCGATHCCAVVEGGAVTCWGKGLDGNAMAPTVVAGHEGATRSIASGRKHDCAVDRVGSVKCWGKNESGQLGDNTIDDSSLPVFLGGDLSEESWESDLPLFDCTCTGQGDLGANAICCDGCYPRREGGRTMWSGEACAENKLFGSRSVCEDGRCVLWGYQESCRCGPDPTECCNGCYPWLEREGTSCEGQWYDDFDMGQCQNGRCVK